MKKHLIAVAVAAAVAAPAAMADTTLYGLAHVSVDYIDNDTETATNDSGNINVQSGSSRLGVKGTEKLSNGLSALYQMEFGVDMADSGAFSARNQFVGLTGGFGTALVGRHDTPMKLAIGKYDLFGDQIGDNGNVAGFGWSDNTAGWNLRTPNVVAYATPNMGGFNALLAYVADHDQADDGVNIPHDNNEFDAYSLNAGYSSKMFNVTGAYEVHNALDAEETSWMIGAGVKFAGLTVNALYQDVEDFAEYEYQTYGLGAKYAFGKNAVKAQYYVADADNVDDEPTMLAVGYDYSMSKQTTLYAAYAMGDNGAKVWGDGHGNKTKAGDDNTAFSVGVKHKF